MGKIKTKRCKRRECGREFVPSVYARHNQSYCADPACRKARRRERQRKSREKRRLDSKWRQRRAQLVAESGKRRQERNMAAARGSVGKEMKGRAETSTTRAMLAGIASIVGKARKREDLMAFLAKIEMKGRKLLGLI